MPSREIEAGPVLAAGGGVVLMVSLFLDWYDRFSAWTSFETLDLVLAGLGLAALVALALPDRVPMRALPVMGVAAFVIVASQIIDHPPVGIDRSTEFGAWLALGGSIAMLIGGAISVARVSLAVNLAERPAPPPPPAPPPAPGPEDSTQRLPGE
jgi:hypothetical protein